MSRHRTGVLLATLLGAGAAGAVETSFIDLPLEELGKLEVAAVSRKAQKLSDMPAAVTVLSAEDIRRRRWLFSGASNGIHQPSLHR